MIFGNYGLLLDSLIVILLIATVVYAMRLSARLNTLRNNRAEMERASRAFAEAAIRAETSIKALKLTADHLSATLQQDINRAQALRDELSFLVDAGEAMAGRLEDAASAAGQSARMSQSRAQQAAGRAPERTEAGIRKDPTPPPAGPAAEPPRAKPAPRSGGPDTDVLRAIENLR